MAINSPHGGARHGYPPESSNGILRLSKGRQAYQRPRAAIGPSSRLRVFTKIHPGGWIVRRSRPVCRPLPGSEMRGLEPSDTACSASCSLLCLIARCSAHVLERNLAGFCPVIKIRAASPGSAGTAAFEDALSPGASVGGACPLQRRKRPLRSAGWGCASAPARCRALAREWSCRSSLLRSASARRSGRGYRGGRCHFSFPVAGSPGESIALPWRYR